MNDYQCYKLLNQEEYKNYEDHLEGVLILNNKVGSQVDIRTKNTL